MLTSACEQATVTHMCGTHGVLLPPVRPAFLVGLQEVVCRCHGVANSLDLARGLAVSCGAAEVALKIQGWGVEVESWRFAVPPSNALCSKPVHVVYTVGVTGCCCEPRAPDMCMCSSGCFVTGVACKPSTVCGLWPHHSEQGCTAILLGACLQCRLLLRSANTPAVSVRQSCFLQTCEVLHGWVCMSCCCTGVGAAGRAVQPKTQHGLLWRLACCGFWGVGSPGAMLLWLGLL
jgi:hypothetical protein